MFRKFQGLTRELCYSSKTRHTLSLLFLILTALLLLDTFISNNNPVLFERGYFFAEAAGQKVLIKSKQTGMATNMVLHQVNAATHKSVNVAIAAKSGE